MIVFEILLSIVLALILAAVLVGPGSRRAPGPGAGFIFFLVILFLVTWAGGVWVHPIGPPLGGISWIGFVAVALIFGLLLAVLIPPTPRAARLEKPVPSERVEQEAAEATAAVFGCVFWLAVIVLAMSIISRYIWYPVRYV